MELDNLSIVPFDWCDASLQHGFYPEDLPEEWQLDFYCGHFSVLFIDVDQDEDFFERLEESLLESNRIVLCANYDAEHALDSDLQHRFMKLPESVQAQTISWLLSSETVLPPLEIAGKPVTLRSSDLRFEGWQASFGDETLSGFAMLLVNDLPTEPTQMAAWLLEALARLPEGPTSYVLAVSAVSFKVAQVDQLQTVAELMGY
jgi:hypothetical protein